jgi:hypothetical protein
VDAELVVVVAGGGGDGGMGELGPDKVVGLKEMRWR